MRPGVMAVVLAILCAGAGPVAAQPPEAASVEYDRFKNRSSVWLDPQWLSWPPNPTTPEASAGGLKLGATFACPGQTLWFPSEVWLVFWYRGKDWRYLREGSRSLTFMVGEQRIPVKVSSHDGEVLTEGREVEVMESMHAKVPVATFLKLFESEAVGQLGWVEFGIGLNDTASVFRQFAQYVRTLPPAPVAGRPRK